MLAAFFLKERGRAMIDERTELDVAVVGSGPAGWTARSMRLALDCRWRFSSEWGQAGK